MSAAKIKIGKQNFDIKFSYSSLKSLARTYKCAKLSGLDKVFKKLQFKDGVEPSLDQLDIIGNIVFAGIKTANKGVDLTIDADDVLEVLINDTDKMTAVLQLFTDSIQQVGTAGK